jgi:hypothetical protein
LGIAATDVLLGGPMELLKIPGVGTSLARDLRELGYHQVEDLRGADPQHMYDELCRKNGVRVDRCVLYVFRCATYFAETDNPEPRLLKWWNWKNRPLAREAAG